MNERCPIFLQFLDCVHQLLLQFPCDFEFNISYLFKLAQHTYSSLFGTFLCNSLLERRQHRVAEETKSVWDFLSSNPYNFCNLLYHPRNEVLLPKFEVRDLLLWQDVYVSEQGRGGAVVTGAAAEVITPGSNKVSKSGNATNPVLQRFLLSWPLVIALDSNYYSNSKILCLTLGRLSAHERFLQLS